MKLKSQQNKIHIRDFDRMVCNGYLMKNKRKHGTLLPNNISCIICGPSNCGKTNVMFNLLFKPNGLRFENVYIFSKSLYQPKYLFKKNIFSEIPLIGYYRFSVNEEVIHLNEAKSNSVILFDDIACERQTNNRNYFTMGRHNNINVFYLCQTNNRNYFTKAWVKMNMTDAINKEYFFERLSLFRDNIYQILHNIYR